MLRSQLTLSHFSFFFHFCAFLGATSCSAVTHSEIIDWLLAQFRFTDILTTTETTEFG